MSTLAATFQLALLQAHPDCQVQVTGPEELAMVCGETELSLSLSRLARACEARPRTCDAETSQFLASVASALAPEPPVRPDSVVPAIRPNSYLAVIPEKDRGQFYIQPLVGDLSVVWMVDSPTTARSLSTADLEALALPTDALRTLAEQNIATQTRSVNPRTAGGITTWDGSYYTSSLLLLPSWRTSVGPSFWVAVPTVDTLLTTTDAAHLPKLKKLAEKAAARSGSSVGSQVYRWEDGGWSVASTGE